jgi:D-glycero-alpha-D-manno-heptose-7-phosphate kinase
MIVSKTPYRIPLSGGGTDVDFYYKKFGSKFISVSVTEYVYVFFTERKLDKNHMIQTSVVEFAKNVKDIKHALIRETIRYFGLKENFQISTISTVPTSTGLGTSSAMVVGLINCIKKYKNLKLSQNEIFKIAYKIERKIVKYAGGWQDQITSVFGGLVSVSISKKQIIKIDKKKNFKNIKKIINSHFLLVYSSRKRDSSKIIKLQKKNIKKTHEFYNKIKKFNLPMSYSIKNKKIDLIGKIFNDHWKLKRNLTNNISNKGINNLYNKIEKLDGFLGGKLIGAGGGGFFLIAAVNKKKIINDIIKNNLNFINLKFENNGSKIIKT